MREKLKTLPLTELKAIAKSQGMKGISTMRKNDLIELLCERAKELGQEQGSSEEQANLVEGDSGASSASRDAAEQRTASGRGQRMTRKAGSGRGSSSATNPEQAASGSGAQAVSGSEVQPVSGSGAQAASGNGEQAVGGSEAQAVTGNGAQSMARGGAQPVTGSGAQPGAVAAQGDNTGFATRENFRRNDGQNRAPRQGGRQAYGRQPYIFRNDNSGGRGEGSGGYRSDGNAGGRPEGSGGYRSDGNAGGRSEGSGGYRSDGNAGGRGEGSGGYRNDGNAGGRTDADRGNTQAGRQDAPRFAASLDIASAEVSRVDGPKVSPSSITPQIQAQFPDQTIQDIIDLDSGIEANGILEVMPDGFGFIRCENFLPGENDVYVAPSQIRRFNLKTGDILVGNRRIKTASEKFAALLYVRSVNGYPPSVIETRPSFEKLTPVFPYERLHMETPGRPNSTAMRVLDLLAPIGKGQRGMIVSPPKAGKTTLLKQVAQAITTNHPDMHLIILLIDERPEEVTDIRESVTGKNVEVIYSTFDELPERHKRVSEMVVERARRLVEHGRDVIILLDSITRLARAYNIVVPPSGRTLSGGMDPAALHMPKRFFGAARKMREGGSLTILATALVNTGSRMDDVVYEEFKGTGNMELVLDRKLSEKRIFPAIDILKSGTRNDHLLLSRDEQEAVDVIRKATSGMKADDAVERILDLFAKTRTNREFIENAKRIRFI